MIIPILTSLAALLVDSWTDLEDHYPETAADTLEGDRGDRVFWAGNVGYMGPTDGTMVPVAAEYLTPIWGNIFDSDKLSALVQAAQERSIVVTPGYANFNVITANDVRESQEYEDDDEVVRTRADIGQLEAQVRDGNHRTFAALLAGSDFSWVMLSDSNKQDIDDHPEMPHIKRMYTEIRRAQRAYHAPQYRRPRRAKVKHIPRLDEVQARISAIEYAQHFNYIELLRMYSGGPEDSRAGTAHNRYERPELFWRILLGDIREQRPDLFDRILMEEPGVVKSRELFNERMALLKELRSLQEEAGIDPGTGKAKILGR